MGQEAGAVLGRSVLAPGTEGLTQWKHGSLPRPGGGGCPGLRQAVARQRGPGPSLRREGCSGDRLPRCPSAIRKGWTRREGSAGPGGGVMPGVATGPRGPPAPGRCPRSQHLSRPGTITLEEGLSLCPAPRGVQGAGVRGPPREGLSTGCGDGASSRRLRWECNSGAFRSLRQGRWAWAGPLGSPSLAWGGLQGSHVWWCPTLTSA